MVPTYRDPILGDFIWTFRSREVVRRAHQSAQDSVLVVRLEAFERGVVLYDADDNEYVLLWGKFKVIEFRRMGRVYRTWYRRGWPKMHLVVQDFAARRYDLTCMGQIFGLHELIRHQQGLPPHSRWAWRTFRSFLEDVKGQ